MKKLTIVIALVLVLTGAWAAEGKLQINGSWRTEVKTAYIHDLGLVIHNNLIWENELVLRLGETGLYGGVWSSFPFEKAKLAEPAVEEEVEAPTFDDERLASLYQLVDSTKQLVELLNPPAEPAPPFEGEIDLYVGYIHGFKRLKLDMSLWYLDFNEVGRYDDDQWSAQAVATYTGLKWFEPYLRLNYYGETGSQSPEGGFAIYPGANFHLPLGFELSEGKEQTLDFGIQSAWSSGALGMDSGYVYTRLSAGTDIPLRKNVFLTPSIMFQLAGPGQTGGEKDYVDGNKWRFGFACRIEF